MNKLPVKLSVLVFRHEILDDKILDKEYGQIMNYVRRCQVIRIRQLGKGVFELGLSVYLLQVQSKLGYNKL